MANGAILNQTQPYPTLADIGVVNEVPPLIQATSICGMSEVS